MYATTLTFVTGVVALEVPKVPVLSQDPEVVAVVDACRVAMLIAGFALAALTIRHAVTVPHNVDTHLLISQFRTRCAALAMALVFVCISTYDRIGSDQVRFQFVVALVFLVVAAKSVHQTTVMPGRTVSGEAALRQVRTAAGSSA